MLFPTGGFFFSYGPCWGCSPECHVSMSSSNGYGDPMGGMLQLRDARAQLDRQRATVRQSDLHEAHITALRGVPEPHVYALPAVVDSVLGSGGDVPDVSTETLVTYRAVLPPVASGPGWGVDDTSGLVTLAFPGPLRLWKALTRLHVSAAQRQAYPLGTPWITVSALHTTQVVTLHAETLRHTMITAAYPHVVVRGPEGCVVDSRSFWAAWMPRRSHDGGPRNGGNGSASRRDDEEAGRQGATAIPARSAASFPGELAGTLSQHFRFVSGSFDR